MRSTILSCISSLLFSSVVYAADCVTSFDQSCSSQGYKQQSLEDGYEYRQQQMEEARKHAEEHDRAIEEAEQAQARAEAAWRRELREEERLIIEAEKVKAMNRQTDAIEGLEGEVRAQEKALKELEMDIQMRDLLSR
jgi:hypothetical protein